MVHVKDTHLRSPNTPFLACGVQWYWCLERHPKTHTVFCGIVHFENTHPRDRKTPSWLAVCSGMGGWGATPEPKRYFVALCSSKTPILSENTFFWLVVCRARVLGVPPQNPHGIFWHCAAAKHPSYVSKNTFSGLWCAVVWVVGAPSENAHDFFQHLCSSKTPILGLQKHLFWLVVCSVMGGWSASPQPP